MTMPYTVGGARRRKISSAVRGLLRGCSRQRSEYAALTEIRGRRARRALITLTKYRSAGRVLIAALSSSTLRSLRSRGRSVSQTGSGEPQGWAGRNGDSAGLAERFCSVTKGCRKCRKHDRRHLVLAASAALCSCRIRTAGEHLKELLVGQIILGVAGAAPPGRDVTPFVAFIDPRARSGRSRASIPGLRVAVTIAVSCRPFISSHDALVPACHAHAHRTVCPDYALSARLCAGSRWYS